MRDRKTNDVVPWSRFFWFTAVIFFSCVLVTAFSFSSFHIFYGGIYHPVLGSTHRTSSLNAVVSNGFPVIRVFSIRETVLLPDQVVLFLKYAPSSRLFTKEELICVYLSFSADDSNSYEPRLKVPPARVDTEQLGEQIVWCPSCPLGLIATVGLKSEGYVPAGPTHRWDSLTYEALIDKDNTTIVFVKGLHLRPERVSNTSRFQCVYGWDLRKTNFLLRSEVLSIAQEIVRCKTPLSILNSRQKAKGFMVSIRTKNRRILPSVARLGHLLDPGFDPVPTRKPHDMCICTMSRNQARFLKEWVMYHAEIGVQRWFIYDNNSDDDTTIVIESLLNAKYNISRHIWPWIKTQEAGFAHCALRARDACDWIGFIDIDEFFHLPTGLMLQDVLQNYSSSTSSSLDIQIEQVPIGEIRISCYNFGPSKHKHTPSQGVLLGYTCRMALPERHKSIVRPEALNYTLINVVHHFHLTDGFRFVDVDKSMMVVNHYKYQVWEVFKDKFYRRVATYVADWQDEQNEGSKDRVPGLGTKAVEPDDWSDRFCEVIDNGLKDRVLLNLANPETSLLPWQDENDVKEEAFSLVGDKKGGKIKRPRRVLL